MRYMHGSGTFKGADLEALATTSAKGCFYSRQNLMKTKMGSMKECVECSGDWENGTTKR